MDSFPLYRSSSVDGHLRGFCFLATVNDAVVNIYGYVLLWTYVFILLVRLGMASVGLMVNLRLA